MDQFGQVLRTLREASGFSLEQVAESTRIRVRHLKALESEQFQELPSDASARGFVRLLARYYKVDERELVRQFEEAIAPRGPVSSPTSVAPTNATVFKVQPSGRRHAGLGVGIGVITLILLILGWMRGSQDQPPHSSTATLTSRQEASVKGSVRRSPIEKPSPPADETKVAAMVPPADGASGTSQEVTANAPTVPPETVQSTARPTGTAPLRLEFQANEQSWVQAQVDNGEVREALLQPGERLLWTATEQMELTIGNAGGVALTFNGEPLASLGESGKVVRLRVTKDGVTNPPPQRKSTPRPASLPPSALAF